MRRIWTAAVLAAMAAGTLAAPQPAVAAIPQANVSPGAYSFTGLASGKQLDVSGVSVAAGAGVTHSSARGSAAQSWWIGQISPGVHRISNVNSGLCLQDPLTPGGQLKQQACASIDSQRWQLTAVDGGYLLKNVASQRVADTSTGAAVTARDANGAGAQTWVLASNKLTRVSTWGTALTAGGPAFAEKTIRMVVRPTVAGNAQRLTFSNRFGTSPLTIGAASVGNQASGLAATAAPTPVKFGGSTSIVIPAGAEAVSDPVNVPAVAGRNLVVSAYVQGSIASSSFHSQAYTTNGIASGNQTAATSGAAFSTAATSFYFLKGIDVISAAAPGAVVALGDSITDGFGSTRDGFNSWPAQLAQKLNAGGSSLGVVNAGISSNRVTVNSTASSLARGMSAVERFDYDVDSVPGVTAVFLFEGINDVGDSVSSSQLIAGYQAIIAKARAAGLEVYGGTMTPFNGVGGYTSAKESVRATANAWILGSGEYDAVLDFSTAAANPSDPTRLLAAYDSGDHIHLSPPGYDVLSTQVSDLLQ